MPDTTDPQPNATVAQSPDQYPRPAGGEPAVVPGYELLGTLGQGAMGVVYKARHVRLDRVVALKMVLGTGPVPQTAMLRFLAEAAAVAAVRHEGVVQVFESGEHAGQPYMALEYLPGGTLADELAKRKGTGGSSSQSVRDAAHLVGRIARGVAAAHAAGIVHRDLKPANVLFDAAGTPKVADFGLVKRDGGPELTQSGDPMGTPLYMSPEQARGDAKFVGPQADVWALGVILYEAMTGARPFAAENRLELMMQIGLDDPVPPRRAVPSVPRDLELICLNCLSKAPHERYPTAAELADDLDRFARGEPISVRPAGPLERGYKWVRRNKVVAGATAAVALALVVGAGVSLAFGLEAREQAADARAKKKDAENAAARERDEATRADRDRNDANDARNALRISNFDLLQSQERVNRTLAKALLGPITADKRGDALTPYETEAVSRVAELRRDPAAWMFLEEAIRTPLTCKQLECRAEFAFHAAIGLDIGRRKKADQLLLARLREPTLPSDQRLSLSLSVLRGGVASRDLLQIVAAVLTNAPAWDKDSDVENLYLLADALAVAAPRMSHADSAKTCTAAAGTLTKALARRTASTNHTRLAMGMSAVAKWIDPAESKTVNDAAQVLANALQDEKQIIAGGALAGALSAVTARMEPHDAVDILTKALASEKKPDCRPTLHNGLLAAVTRMNHTKKTEVLVAEAIALTNALHRERNSDTRISLGAELSRIAALMEPADGACFLTSALEREQDLIVRVQLAVGLAPLAARMDLAGGPEVRSTVYSTLTAGLDKTILERIGKEELPRFQKELITAMAAMAIRKQSDEGAKSFPTLLTGGHAKWLHPDARIYLAEAVATVAAETPDKGKQTCASAAHALAKAICDETNSYTRANLAEALAAVAAQMNADEGKKPCADAARALARALGDETNWHHQVRLGAGLAAVTTRMAPDPEGERICAKAADQLLAKLSKEKDPVGGIGSVEFAMGHLTVARLWRTAPIEGKKHYATAISSLISVEFLNRDERRRLIGGLAAARVNAADNPKVLIDALAKVKSSAVSLILSMELLAVVSKMEPTDAARVRAAAACNVIEADLTDFRRVDFAMLILGFFHGQVELFDDDISPSHMRPMARVATGAFLTSPNLLAALPLLPHFHLRPLPPQELVELLKHAFCVGAARRAVLDALEYTYQWPCRDQWDFVEYAQQHQPQLDLFTPPRRHQPWGTNDSSPAGRWGGAARKRSAGRITSPSGVASAPRAIPWLSRMGSHGALTRPRSGGDSRPASGVRFVRHFLCALR